LQSTPPAGRVAELGSFGRFTRPVKIIIMFFGSWLAGLAAYLCALALFYRQSISRGDLLPVCFWSLLAFALAFFALYLPVLLGVRRLLRGVRPLWPFPFVASLLGVIPTAAICLYWGGGARSLVSPEASLFYEMFGTVGIVVGLSFAFIYRHDNAP
jgi:hypothetical protein